MNSTLGTINTIASWIPSKIRGVIYALIGLFWLVEAIWDIIPNDENGGKIAATISLIGLIMAAVNTDLVPEGTKPADGGDRGESTLMTIVLVLVIVVLAIFLLGIYNR